MGQADLQKAVARAIHEAACCNEPDRWDAPRWHRASEAAIRVVLAEAQQSIKALGINWTHVRAGVTSYEPAKAADFKREVLGVLAGLEPPPPV